MKCSLGESYTARSVLSSRFCNDVLDMARATVAEADALVSWNFQHIVRLDKIRSFSAVNLKQRYRPLTIHSPREVIDHGSEE